MRGSDITKVEAGFNLAAKKSSPGSLSFGMGVDSTKISPCCERRTRICKPMSLEVTPRNALAQHLVGLIRILALQGHITSVLEPIDGELRGRGPRMGLGGRDQPIHCIREEKVWRLFIAVAGCIPLGGKQYFFVVPKG